MHSLDAFISKVHKVRRELEHRRGTPLTHLFLATDDAHAEAAFRAAFGELLHVQPHVRRTTGGVHDDSSLNEVHIKSASNPLGGSLQDAVDVLCDALLLASCDTVLHMDSNVTSAVACMNPRTRMVHVNDVV